MLVQKKISEPVLQVASKGNLTKERRERLRAKETKAIPWWYIPCTHLASTTGLSSLVFIISLIQIIRLATINTIVEWLIVVPFVFILSNFIEWVTHKHLQHRRRKPMQSMYDSHTPIHHMVYVEEDMVLHSNKEFRLILIPAIALVGVTLFGLMNSFILAKLWSPSAGWCFMLAASFYVATAEFLHLCYHLPETNFLNRFKLFRNMKAHHAKHHDPKLMQKFNFNITLPLFDWLMGTLIKKDIHADARTKSSINS